MKMYLESSFCVLVTVAKRSKIYKEQIIISRYLEDLGILPDLDRLVYHLALGIPLDLDHLGILLHLLHLNYRKESKKV